jgi:hypothetical protein
MAAGRPGSDPCGRNGAGARPGVGADGPRAEERSGGAAGNPAGHAAGDVGGDPANRLLGLPGDGQKGRRAHPAAHHQPAQQGCQTAGCLHRCEPAMPPRRRPLNRAAPTGRVQVAGRRPIDGILARALRGFASGLGLRPEVRRVGQTVSPSRRSERRSPKQRQGTGESRSQSSSKAGGLLDAPTVARTSSCTASRGGRVPSVTDRRSAAGHGG